MKNAITWFEIPAVDLERARAFYSALLDEQLVAEQFDGVNQAFLPYDREGGIGGSIVQLEGERAKTAVGRPIVYLEVGEALESVLERAVAAGAQVLMPSTDIGKFGVIAVICDSEGNHVGLHAVS